jgi:hypothetical protein
MQVHKLIPKVQAGSCTFSFGDISLPGVVQRGAINICLGHYFLLWVEKQKEMEGRRQFCAMVQLIGTKKQAERFVVR